MTIPFYDHIAVLQSVKEYKYISLWCSMSNFTCQDIKV